MLKQAERLADKHINGRRYTDTVIEHFCISVWILGGRRVFEILYSNLKGVFPSPRTIETKLAAFDIPVQEGIINVKVLVEYLTIKKLKPVVFLSADATAVIPKLEYHSKSNSVVGCSLPLGPNGLPNHNISIVKSALDIHKLSTAYPKATTLIVIMAQPIADGCAPMRICSFGTDNRYTAMDVLNRVHTIVRVLRDSGIRARGYAADGDSRETKFQRQHIGLSRKTAVTRLGPSHAHLDSLRNKADWFSADSLPADSVLMFQDTTHLGAKERVGLLRRGNFFPFGGKIASATDLETLMEIKGKEQTFLRETDINLSDKMNYDAVNRLTNPIIRKLLEDHVKGSDATCFYLKLMDYSTSSFLDKNLSPLERIYRIWFVVFSLRIWRFWLKCDNCYTLQRNCVSLNVYLCVEINAHSLILLILNSKEDDELITCLAGSQPCEWFFKGLRSFTPVGSTVVNCTVNGFVNSRCRKVDVHLRLMSQGEQDGIIFPRYEKHLDRVGGRGTAPTKHSLPKWEAIFAEVERAKSDATAALVTLGVEVDGDEQYLFSANLPDSTIQQQAATDEDTDETDDCEEIQLLDEPEEEDDVDSHDIQVLDSLKEVILKNYAVRFPTDLSLKNLENGPFLQVTGPAGETRIFKKSSLLWYYQTEFKKQSADRDRRFMQSASLTIRKALIVKEVARNKVRPGDWCVFKAEDDDLKVLSGLKFMLGRVISLGALEGTKTQLATSIWSWEQGTEENDNVGALCIWYKFIATRTKSRNKVVFSLTGLASEIPLTVHGLHPCNLYLFSIPSPDFCPNETKDLLLDKNIDKIREFLVSFKLI